LSPVRFFENNKFVEKIKKPFTRNNLNTFAKVGLVASVIFVIGTAISLAIISDLIDITNLTQGYSASDDLFKGFVINVSVLAGGIIVGLGFLALDNYIQK
jgi:hypothetical protein